MKVRSRRAVIHLAGVIAMLGASTAFAACPGDSAYATVKSIAVNSPGGGANLYIEVDASTGSNVDVCSCRDANNALYMLRPENPLTDGSKLQLAVAMEAKALNKRIKVYQTGCYFGASSGYAGYTQITMEP